MAPARLEAYAMGMVMLIAVGDSVAAELVIPDEVPSRAKTRFEEIARRFD